MQYNLASAFERTAFQQKVNAYLDKGKVVELTEKTFRSRSQNSYLHLLIGVVALETGNTLADAKEYYFKRLCNRPIFEITKTDRLGNTFTALRSSADLTKEEMSMAIDRFKRWGAEQGIYMPSPEDKSLLRDIEIEMGRMKAYL